MGWKAGKEFKRVPKVNTKSTFYSFKEVNVYGRDCIDVREHFERADGSIQHTAKGISIPVEMFLDMVRAFCDVSDEMATQD